MDKKRICIVCVIMVFSIMTGYLFEKKSKEEISMKPDVVSSISMNRDQYLTVVANRNRIEDKEEFAKLLVKMCRDNSFHTIKFSTDRGYATGIHMQVYLCEEDMVFLKEVSSQYGFQAYLFEELEPYNKQIAAEAYEKWLKKELEMAEEDIAKGRVYTMEEVQEHLDRIR